MWDVVTSVLHLLSSLHDIYTHVTSPSVPCSRKMNIDVEIQMLDVLPLLNI